MYSSMLFTTLTNVNYWNLTTGQTDRWRNRQINRYSQQAGKHVCIIWTMTNITRNNYLFKVLLMCQHTQTNSS